MTISTDPTKSYSVTLWGSHPDNDNDDAMTGEDFDTIEEARAAFADPEAFFGSDEHSGMVGGWTYFSDCSHVEIDGPDINEVRQIVSNAAIAKMRRRAAADDRTWRSEIAMQAGMGMGIDAYNDAMGWS